MFQQNALGLNPIIDIDDGKDASDPENSGDDIAGEGEVYSTIPKLPKKVKKRVHNSLILLRSLF